MTEKQVNEYIVTRYSELPKNRVFKVISEELAERGHSLTRNAVRNRYDRIREKVELEREETQLTVEERIESDYRFSRLKDQDKDTKEKYKKLLEKYERQGAEFAAAFQMKEEKSSYKIESKTRKNESESTAVMVWSDWHLEERVDPRTVNHLNSFNLEIATKRTEKLFTKCVDFIRMYQQDTKIKTAVLALLGDFISNDIHEELVETAELQPVQAILFAQRQLISGIDFILNHTEIDLVIPCHSGNHARTTKTRHVATEAGHSLEYYMYHVLADHYRDNPRVEFLVNEGYMSYLSVYGETLRLHHGHDLKYGGGIGGLFIPTYKAISQWNKAKLATLDLFGHYHQTKDGGNFLCNGSLIGYNAYALSIKADYEPPRQNFFLINKDLGRTIMSPIHL